MKNILRLTLIGAALATGVSVAAAAEGTDGRAYLDDPVRHWNNDLATGPAAEETPSWPGQTSGYDSGYQTPGFYPDSSYYRRGATPYE